MEKVLRRGCTTLGTITELKEKYNESLKVFWKATMYLESSKTTLVQQEKWMPKYLRVVEECRSYISQLYNMGYKATEEEIKGGFVCLQNSELEQQLKLIKE